tara:strand:+ start:384 stop:890 length:507 start_codon:yes stop_codon:yes gene_type:complete
MTYLETARSIVCGIIAVALSMTVAAVEGLLSHRPDWLERVENLANTLRAVGRENAQAAAGAARRAPTSSSPAASSPADDQSLPAPDDLALDIDQNRLLLAYNELWEFVQDIRSDGLSLDEGFCERIEREWSVTTLLTYLRNADKSLQEHASRKLADAASLLSAEGRAD